MQESRLKNETNFEHDMKKRHIAEFRVNMTWFSAEYDIKRCHMDKKYGIWHWYIEYDSVYTNLPTVYDCLFICFLILVSGPAEEGIMRMMRNYLAYYWDVSMFRQASDNE